MWEEEQGEEEEGWGIKEEVLWGKRKGKVCEVMQLAAALCGGQLLYSPCCIVPPFCLADPFFDLLILWSLVVAAVSSPHISIHLLSSQHVSLYSNRISVTLFGELLYLYWYTYVTTKNRYGAQQGYFLLCSFRVTLSPSRVKEHASTTSRQVLLVTMSVHVHMLGT